MADSIDARYEPLSDLHRYALDFRTAAPEHAHVAWTALENYVRSAALASMRDRFAGLALSGLVVNGDNFDVRRLTAYAYEMADAMLKARQSHG